MSPRPRQCHAGRWRTCQRRQGLVIHILACRCSCKSRSADSDPTRRSQCELAGEHPAEPCVAEESGWWASASLTVDGTREKALLPLCCSLAATQAPRRAVAERPEKLGLSCVPRVPEARALHVWRGLGLNPASPRPSSPIRPELASEVQDRDLMSWMLRSLTASLGARPDSRASEIFWSRAG